MVLFTNAIFEHLNALSYDAFLTITVVNEDISSVSGHDIEFTEMNFTKFLR